LRIVKGGTIDVDLDLVKQIRPKSLLQGHEIIRRVIDGLKLVLPPG
jgi:hypothetical protein